MKYNFQKGLWKTDRNVYMRLWRIANLNARREYDRNKAKEYYTDPDKRKRILNLAKLNHRMLRNEIFEHYGSKCACCGEAEKEFLSIDHIKENGAEHRRSLFGRNTASGLSFYRWLKKNNYPEGFQVLCMNCNFAKHKNHGICPHKLLEA